MVHESGQVKRLLGICLNQEREGNIKMWNFMEKRKALVEMPRGLLEVIEREFGTCRQVAIR